MPNATVVPQPAPTVPVPLTIGLKDLCRILDKTDRGMIAREGRTLPLPEAYGTARGRCYKLVDVLWGLNGHERERLMRALGLSVEHAKAMHACHCLTKGT